VNLRIFIDHTVKTVTNRVDEAVSALANFLNTMVFAPQGPHKALKQFLVPETHTGSALKAFLPDGYEGRVFPSSTKEAKHLPLGTDTPPNLLLGVGSLRMFDFSQNNSVPSQPPQCTFSPAGGDLLITGALSLDRYGPLGFEIMYCVAAALGGEFEKICKVKTPEQVDKILDAYVTRWA
jgi:hypothetical protein